MSRLIVWLNNIIKKHKKFRRWQRIVTVLAAMITFATTYALILPAITVEKNNTEEVAGMYLEPVTGEDDMLVENALEPAAVMIAADQENAVTYSYTDDAISATAVFSTDEEIPEGAELVVNYVDSASEEYADLSSRAVSLLEKEFIYDITTCVFYDYALVCDNIDVTPETGLVDLQILFRDNTVEHKDDIIFAGRFERPSDETDELIELSADGTLFEEEVPTESSEYLAEPPKDQLISVNVDESSVAELADGIIMSFSLKGNDLAESESVVGILAGSVNEDVKAQAAETDAAVPDADDAREGTMEDDAPVIDVEDVTSAPELKNLKCTGSDYTVILTYDETSGVPEGASLDVSEIARDSEEYQTYLEEAGEAMGLGDGETLPLYAARFFDIKIVVDNQEFTPESGVSVEITYNEPLAEHSDTEVNAVHFKDESPKPEVIDASTSEILDDGTATVEFTAESFSVYGVIYTVDFHYEVDGQEYDFSIPGGGFVSFEHLVEVLGIAGSTESADVYQDSISLNEVSVSETAKTFVAAVETIECSNPDLIWIGKVYADTTIGALKEANELEIEYSSELTEEEIAEINAQTVEAGDWVLISLVPFSSDESLTVTMQNGDCFTIELTDAQQVTSDDPSVIDSDYTYIICHVDEDGNYQVLRTDGEYETISKADAEADNYKKLDQLGNDYRWTFYYVFKEKDRESTLEYVYYFIRPFNDKSKSIALNDPGDTLIQTGTNNIAVLPQYSDPDDPETFLGFIFTGYGASLTWSSDNGFYGDGGSLIQIFKQDELETYEFTVLSDDEEAGTVDVAGKDELYYEIEVEVEDREGNITTETQTIHYYLAETNEEKKNGQVITATPTNSDKYVFNHWELNGEKVYLSSDGTIILESDDPEDAELLGSSIDTGILPIPYNSSELRAYFTINPSYEPAAGEDLGRVVDEDSLQEWLDDLKTREFPLNSDATDKTAEVYDYENRIYRVDLTSKASLSTFAGTIDLGFIIDVSSSMDFPSYLYDAVDDNDSEDSTRKENLTGADAYGEWTVSDFNNWNWTYNMTQGEVWGFKTDRTYYLITKDNTATVFKLKCDNGTWKTCDASKEWNDTNAKAVTTTNNKYIAGESYVIKKAGDLDDNGDPRTRSYYLEQSLNSTLDELHTILNILSIADTSESSNPDVKIAWNSFNNYLPNVATLDGGQSLQHTFTSVRDSEISLNYDHDNTYGGGTSTDIALLDAAGYMRNDVLSDWVAYSDWYGNHAYNQDIININNYSRIYDGAKRTGAYYSFEAGGAGNSTYRWYNTWYSSTYDSDIGYTQNYENGFQWDDSHTKYAVLITDGAPQRGGKDVHEDYVKEAAELLESRGVKLITVGLSMDAVPVGSQILYDIASTSDEDGLPLYYTAKTGDELEYVMYEILQLIMDDAVVYGDVTDPIGEAFYPVDKETGSPLSAGNVINLDGEYIAENESELTDEQIAAGYGIIYETDSSSGDNGEYTVKWVNQPISVEGWHGTVYVKAKEDLLGGNGVDTNGGDAIFTADSYSIGDQDDIQIIGNRSDMYDDNGNIIGPYTKTVTKETPKVNVNELSFSSNASSWNVYIGENVDPKDELQRLFSLLEVEEVVTEADDTDNDGFPDVLSSDGQLRYNLEEDSFFDDREKDDPDETVPESGDYYLADYEKFSIEALIIDLIEEAIESSDDSRSDWSSFLSDSGLNWDYIIEEALTDEGIVIPYHKYGITDNSSVTIILRKEIVDGEEWDIANKSPHDTTVLSDESTVDSDGVRQYNPVERYTLSVRYSPDYDESLPKGQGGSGTTDFHTGTYGTMYQGHAAGTETARSVHEISTFERTLTLIKTEMSNDDITLEGAKFRITDEDGNLVRPDPTYAVDGDTIYQKVSENIEGATGLVQDPDSTLTGWYLTFDSEYFTVNDGKCYKKVEEDTPGDVELVEGSDEWYIELTDTAYTYIGTTVYKKVSDTVEGATQGKNDPTETLSGWYLILPEPTYAADSDGRIYKKVADESVSGALELTEGSDEWYVLFDDVDYTTDSDGLLEITTLLGGKTYYLSEVCAPAGYNLLPEQLKITVTSEGVFTTLDGVEITSSSEEYDTDTGKPTVAYNWDQEYNLDGTENAHIVITNSDDTTISEYFDEYTEDETIVLNKYFLRNNPGVELPETGGRGTARFYALGIIFMSLAAAVLLLRKIALQSICE